MTFFNLHTQMVVVKIFWRLPLRTSRRRNSGREAPAFSVLRLARRGVGRYKKETALLRVGPSINVFGGGPMENEA